MALLSLQAYQPGQLIPVPPEGVSYLLPRITTGGAMEWIAVMPDGTQVQLGVDSYSRSQIEQFFAQSPFMAETLDDLASIAFSVQDGKQVIVKDGFGQDKYSIYEYCASCPDVVDSAHVVAASGGGVWIKRGSLSDVADGFLYRQINTDVLTANVWYTVYMTDRAYKALDFALSASDDSNRYHVVRAITSVIGVKETAANLNVVANGMVMDSSTGTLPKIQGVRVKIAPNEGYYLVQVRFNYNVPGNRATFSILSHSGYIADADTADEAQRWGVLVPFIDDSNIEQWIADYKGLINPSVQSWVIGANIDLQNKDNAIIYSGRQFIGVQDTQYESVYENLAKYWMINVYELNGLKSRLEESDTVNNAYIPVADGVLNPRLNAELLGGKSSSDYLDKATYDVDNDGIVNKAVTISGTIDPSQVQPQGAGSSLDAGMLEGRRSNQFVQVLEHEIRNDSVGDVSTASKSVTLFHRFKVYENPVDLLKNKAWWRFKVDIAYDLNGDHNRGVVEVVGVSNIYYDSAIGDYKLSVKIRTIGQTFGAVTMYVTLNETSTGIGYLQCYLFFDVSIGQFTNISIGLYDFEYYSPYLQSIALMQEPSPSDDYVSGGEVLRTGLQGISASNHNGSGIANGHFYGLYGFRPLSGGGNVYNDYYDSLSGYDMFVRGTFYSAGVAVTSDVREKTGIEVLPSTFVDDIIDALPGVIGFSYRDSDKRWLGFPANAIVEGEEYLVENRDSVLGLNQTNLLALLVDYVRRLGQRVKELEQIIENNNLK